MRNERDIIPREVARKLLDRGDKPRVLREMLARQRLVTKPGTNIVYSTEAVESQQRPAVKRGSHKGEILASDSIRSREFGGSEKASGRTRFYTFGGKIESGQENAARVMGEKRPWRK